MHHYFGYKPFPLGFNLLGKTLCGIFVSKETKKKLHAIGMRVQGELQCPLVSGDT